MDLFKMLKFVEEFPFLEGILKDSIPDNIKIKKIDENILSRVPGEYFHNGSCGETRDEASVHFILKDGSVLYNAVAPSGESKSNYAHSTPHSWAGESILEAIFARVNYEELKFIVVDTYYYDNWIGKESTEEWNITIYKVTKKERGLISQLVERVKHRAAAEVAASK